MKIKLKQDQLRKLLIDMHKHGFTSDGCACGEYAYQLDKDLWLFIKRGCKKSSYTPDNKWWHIKGVEFYKHIDVHRFDTDDLQWREISWDEEDDLLHNVKLDKYQEEQIILRAKRITKADGYGKEFK